MGGPPIYPEARPAFQATPNTYARSNFDYQPVEMYEESGSYALGMLAGLALSLLGLIVVYCVGKEETKRGAGHGFLIRVSITLLVFLFVL